jgi:hypothetical protein
MPLARYQEIRFLLPSARPLQEVSYVLGHRDIHMLAQTYRHKIRSVVDVTAGQDRMLIG